MSSLYTQHFISVIENQSSEGREGGMGLQVCLSESLSTCDTFDLILAYIPSSPLGLFLCITAVNLSQESPTACTSHGISKFISQHNQKFFILRRGETKIRFQKHSPCTPDSNVTLLSYGKLLRNNLSFSVRDISFQ